MSYDRDPMETLRLIEQMQQDQERMESQRRPQPQQPPSREPTGAEILVVIGAIAVCIYFVYQLVVWAVNAVVFAVTCPYRIGTAMVQGFEHFTWSWTSMVSHPGVIAAELAVICLLSYLAFRRKLAKLPKGAMWLSGIWMALLLALLASTAVGLSDTSAIALVELVVMLALSVGLIREKLPFLALLLPTLYGCVILWGVIAEWL